MSIKKPLIYFDYWHNYNLDLFGPFLNFENRLHHRADSHLCECVFFSCFAIFNSTQLWWATPRAMCAQCVGEPWVRLARLDGIFSSTPRTASPTALSVAHASQTPTTLTGSAHLQLFNADFLYWVCRCDRSVVAWSSLIDHHNGPKISVFKSCQHLVLSV